METLVVYYSWSGKTELVAKAIAKTLNADITKAEEVRKRKGLFGFIDAIRGARKNECSEIKSVDFNLDKYDIVFIGTPVWSLNPTPAINAFISKSNLKGKKVVIFVTMGFFGSKNAIRVLTDIIHSKGGKVINSFAIRTGVVRDEKIIQKGYEIGKQYKD